MGLGLGLELEGQKARLVRVGVRVRVRVGVGVGVRVRVRVRVRGAEGAQRGQHALREGGAPLDASGAKGAGARRRGLSVEGGWDGTPLGGLRGGLPGILRGWKVDSPLL